MSQEIKVELTPKDTKDFLDRLGILATIFVPISIACAGYFISEGQKDRELNAKYLELAIDVLKANKDDTAPEVREWAYLYFKKNSGFADEVEKAKDELLNGPIFTESNLSKIVPGSISVSMRLLAKSQPYQLELGGTNDFNAEVYLQNVSLTSQKNKECETSFLVDRSYSARSTFVPVTREADSFIACLVKNDSSLTGRQLSLVTNDYKASDIASNPLIHEVSCNTNSTAKNNFANGNILLKTSCGPFAFVFE